MTTAPWDRLLWAVEIRWSSPPTEPMLIGVAWHNHLQAPEYPGEPTRALLFQTRRQARAWCAEAIAKHAMRSPDWRFRPVRVRERVTPLPPIDRGTFGITSGRNPRKNAD